MTGETGDKLLTYDPCGTQHTDFDRSHRSKIARLLDFVI
jgi:hypothetical protein